MVQTEILIDAPRLLVWDVLMNWPKYNQWNRFMINLRGDARVGGEIFESLKFDFLPRAILGKSFVKTIRAPEEFTWQGSFVHSFHRMGNGTHRFLFEAISENQTRLKHSETYAGLLVPFVFPLIRRVAEPHFKKMDADLKNRAESLYKTSGK